MLTFTQANAKTRIKRLNSEFNDWDSTKFTDIFDPALKMAMSEEWDEMIAADDPFTKASTLSEVTAPSTGTEKINTTIGDVFLVSLLAGAERILDDTIWIFKSATGEYEAAPRIDIDAMIIGGAGETVVGFYEVNGKVAIYIKEATFTTPPADFHYNYRRVPTMPAADGDPLDIPPTRFSSLCSKISAFMQF